jgi:(R)-amidase
MARRAIKIGIAQIPILMGDKAANVRSMLAWIARAGRSRCDLVVLPECCLAGWLSPAAARAAEPLPGPLTEKLGGLAVKHRMGIVVGLEERAGKAVHNSAVLIDREGRVALRHRKVNELEIGKRVYTCGRTLAVVEFDGVPVGIDICADSWGPEITDALYAMGARIVLSPCAWAIQPGGEEANTSWIAETYRARTAGKRLTIVAANSVGRVTQGPWRGRVLHGDSMVVGPDGRLRRRGPRNRQAFFTIKLEA